MGKYQPYPEYADAKISWLGRMPSHWIRSRIKFTNKLNPSKSEVRTLPGDREVSFLPMEAIGEDGSLDVSRTKSLEDVLDGYSYVANGDVMIAKITPCFENGKGAIAKGLCNGIGFATTEVIVLRPLDRCDGQFVYYLLSSEEFRSIAEGSMYGAGGQKRVADNFVANYPVAWPGSAEQATIAAFLNHETTKIDRLIARQERLIELLKEKRQAVISHAVTKGLNPNAPMKDSGVEWLGEVPAHWEASRLKYLVPGVTVGIVINPSSYYRESGVPCLRSLNISSGYIVPDQLVYISEESNEQLSKSKIYDGDIVVVRTGQAGTAAIVTKDFDGTNCIDLLIVRKSNRILSKFLYHVIGSDRSIAQVKAFTVGAIQGHFNTSTLAELWLTCPPIEEQIEILNYLIKKLAAFDLLLEKAGKSIALLQEHRTALISAAVTGKIDVRSWQKPITQPQEAAIAASA